MKYFDVHTHTNTEQLNSQAEEIAEECLDKNIFYLDIGTNVQTSELATKHADKYTNVFATVGIHPNEIEVLDLNVAFDELETLLRECNRIVAIGETGYDFHYPNVDILKQQQVFMRHIELAKKHNMPLMIHVRDAHKEMIEAIKKYCSNMVIIIHCFTGDKELIKQYIDLDCYISINGVITFNNAESLQEAIKIIPIKKLLSETDAPWLSPTPLRGKINTPLNIPIIVKKMAECLSMNEEVLADILFNNAIDAFKIK